ncbi:MAG: amidase [Minwuia sp.]|nr:amidase [Minwuia sp.]
MANKALHHASALRIAAAIRDGETTAVEMLEVFIDRTERLNQAINAIIATDFDAAREAAAGLDLLNSQGYRLGAFHGVPMTVKESYNVAGLPTTAGDPDYADNIAKADAVVVDRIKRQGGVVFGKTNVPLNLTDWQSYNAVYGGTGNPWDAQRTPGGSSGGSAAALAAGLTGLEFGSDIGASIRNPAHYCGVFGHKPTFDIVPRRGHGKVLSNKPSDISVCGPLARSAMDMEVAMLAIAGADPVYGEGWHLTLPKPTKDDLGDFKVALMLETSASEVDDEVKTKLLTLADDLRRAGVTVDERDPFAVDWDQYHEDYFRLFRPVTHSSLPQEVFDGWLAQRPGVAEDDRSYNGMNIKAATESYYEWAAADRRRYGYRDQWKGFFQDYDLLLCPAAASAAFLREETIPREHRMITVNGHDVEYNDQLFWAGIAGSVYLPGTVAPLGPGGVSGLPVGVQIVGPYMGDLTTIRFAHLMEQAFGGCHVPPGFE